MQVTSGIFGSMQATRRHGIEPKCLSEEVLGAMLRYHWPGNVRELRNVVESMVLLAEGSVLTGDDLPPELESVARMAPRDVPAVPIATHESNGKLVDSTRAAIATAIRIENGNLTRAAIRLGIAKSTLDEKMKRFGIDRSQVQALQRDPLAEGSMRRS